MTNQANSYQVQFQTPDKQQYEVQLQVKTAVPPNLLASCGKPQTKPIPTYQLLKCENLSDFTKPQ